MLGVLGLVFGGVLRGSVVRCCVVECWVVGWLGGWVGEYRGVRGVFFRFHFFVFGVNCSVFCYFFLFHLYTLFFFVIHQNKLKLNSKKVKNFQLIFS